MSKNSKLQPWKINLSDAANYLTALIKEFAIYFYLLFKPPVLLLFILTLVVIFFAQKQSGDIRLFFDISAAILASILGGIITHYFIEYKGNTFLIKKSVSAIRNLQLLKTKVKNISKRISELRGKDNKRDSDEIENLVENVHKDILNSIGDWGDVNPQSETITDFYELIDSKEEEIKKIQKDKKILEEQKDSLNQDKKDEIARLEKEISGKNKEISNLSNQIYGLNQSNIGIVSGSVLSGASGSQVQGTLSPVNKCRNCGMAYFPSALSGFLSVGNDLCDDCRQKRVI